MEHCSCIYSIRNKINNKMYIGQTSDYHKRVSHHLSSLRRNKSHNRHLQAAFLLYGEDSFEFSIVEKCNVDMLDEREMFWIEHYDSYNNGYNLDIGGGGIRGYKYTDEQKAKISKALKGRVFSDETRRRMSEGHADFSGEKSPMFGVKWADRFSPERQAEIKAKMSLAQSGENNANYGKKMSDEQKKKLSDSHKRRFVLYGNPLKGRERPNKRGSNAPNVCPVVCVNTGEQFDTIRIAAKEKGVPASCISSCISDNLDVFYAGYDVDGTKLLWRRLEDYIPMSKAEISEYIRLQEAKMPGSYKRGVKCISTGEMFSSMREACDKYGIDPSSLSAHCRRRKSINGCGRHPLTNELLKWEYVEK